MYIAQPMDVLNKNVMITRTCSSMVDFMNVLKMRLAQNYQEQQTTATTATLNLSPHSCMKGINWTK